MISRLRHRLLPAAAAAEGVVARLEQSVYCPPIAIKLLKLVPQFSAYAFASVIALASDVACYLTLIASGYRAVLAGITGYAIGMTVHYVLSSRFVFNSTRTQKSETRLFGEFALSGMAGLAVTGTVVAIATNFAGATALTAKLWAVALSFLMVYVLRRFVVFK